MGKQRAHGQVRTTFGIMRDVEQFKLRQYKQE